MDRRLIYWKIDKYKYGAKQGIPSATMLSQIWITRKGAKILTIKRREAAVEYRYKCIETKFIIWEKGAS